MKQTIKCFIAVVAAMFVAVSAFAQVTTSSLGGRIVDNAGEPVIGAAVVATHEPSGTNYGVVTNEDGRYAIQGMRSGGPYKVEISCLGYQTVINTDITLLLGEPYALNASLNEDKEMLSEALVVAQAASKFAGDKTGAATNISSRQMESLPNISRSLEDVSKLSPYGGNGMNFAGSDGRSSNFTVDGANFNNNFGLNEGLPGGGNPISIDAIEEMQVVIAPYDVRQTNFIGGGMNAITKSGTNQFKGTAYAYHRNEWMRGNTNFLGEEFGNRAKDRITTYGFTLGGPIIKNKLFFFVNFEQSQIPTEVNLWRASKDGVADPDHYISRVTEADMEAVKKHLMDNYGYDAGSYTDYPAQESNTKMLARLDWNITDNHHLAVRYNYTLNQAWKPTNGSSGNMVRRATASRLSQYGMAFANSIYSQDNIVHSFAFDLNSRITNNLSNQLLVTVSKLDDMRGSPSEKFPFIDILHAGDYAQGKITPYISAGYELFTWNNGVHNTVINAKDDITYFTGNHKITAGISYEYQMADNSYMRNGTGYYRYASLDDFLNQRAPETVCLTYGYGGEENPAARVRYHQVGAYAQDEWAPVENFKLTYGLRLDALMFDNQDLMTNNAILAVDYNGKNIDTGKWPTTKIRVSPRVGFTWDVLGDKSLKVRGGTGFFSGRLPLVFFTNMPTNSGMIQNITSISTDKDGVAPEALKQFAGPMITDVNQLIDKLHSIDPVKFPKEITPDKGVLPSSIQAVDPKFKMPTVWKSSIAVDYQLPVGFPLTVTGEFMYNKTIQGVMLQDWNMKDPSGFSRLTGVDDRHVYPAKGASYTGTNAYVLTNTNKGYGYTANILINAQPIPELNITASYTHTVQKEVSGMPGSNAESAFTYIPSIEGPNHVGLHNSQYVTPDRAFVNLTYNDKGNNHYSLFYEAWRGGGNYSYMYSQDLNKDGYAYDLIYIPAKADEVLWATPEDAENFFAYVAQDKYLSTHKGQYAEAYSVYSPWVHRLNFRFAHDFKVKAGNSTNVLQLNVDFNNILNMFNPAWGVAKYMNNSINEGRILSVDHINNEGAPVFKSNVNGNMPTWAPSSGIGQCWYFQVGIKYMFN